MAKISDQMDNVFDDGLDFDVIFDQEDRLIDTVAGVKEDGTSVLGDEYEGFFDEDGNFSIPGEPNTDDGKADNTAGKKNLVDRTTSAGCPSVDQKLNRDAESDGTAPAPKSAEAQVDDTDTVPAFRKDLGYTKEEADVSAPGEADTDDGKNDEPANNSAAKTTMANGQNEQKPDDNSSVKESVDSELLDEGVMLDLELTDESVLQPKLEGLDAELLDEAVLAEADAAEKDPEEELVDAVDSNNDEGPDLEYEVGSDDVMIDDLLN